MAGPRVRVWELQESLKIVRFCLENLPEGDPSGCLHRKNAPKGRDPLPVRSAAGGSWRTLSGTNGTDRVERVDIRTPTLANWTSVAMCLVNQNIADIPVIVAAIDPCLSCTSRITLLDNRTKKEGVVNFDELIRRFRSRDPEQEGT